MQLCLPCCITITSEGKLTRARRTVREPSQLYSLECDHQHSKTNMLHNKLLHKHSLGEADGRRGDQQFQRQVRKLKVLCREGWQRATHLQLVVYFISS
jgi:hypothetical protein